METQKKEKKKGGSWVYMNRQVREMIFLLSLLLVNTEGKTRLFFFPFLGIREELEKEILSPRALSFIWHHWGALDQDNKESFQFAVLLRFTEGGV